MKNKFKVLITIYCCISMSISSKSIAQRSITAVNTSWNPTIPAITEAGNDYSGDFTSSTNQITLNAIIPLLLGSGKVTVHQQGNSWHENLKLSILRTGDGNKKTALGIVICAGCFLTGGNSTFIQINNTPTNLFEIHTVLSLAEFDNIPFQLKLSGASVTIPAKPYSTTLVFTIGPT